MFLMFFIFIRLLGLLVFIWCFVFFFFRDCDGNWLLFLGWNCKVFWSICWDFLLEEDFVFVWFLFCMDISFINILFVILFFIFLEWDIWFKVFIVFFVMYLNLWFFFCRFFGVWSWLGKEFMVLFFIWIVFGCCKLFWFFWIIVLILG